MHVGNTQQVEHVAHVWQPTQQVEHVAHVWQPTRQSWGNYSDCASGQLSRVRMYEAVIGQSV